MTLQATEGTKYEDHQFGGHWIQSNLPLFPPHVLHTGPSLHTQIHTRTRCTATNTMQRLRLLAYKTWLSLPPTRNSNSHPLRPRLLLPALSTSFAPGQASVGRSHSVMAEVSSRISATDTPCEAAETARAIASSAHSNWRANSCTSPHHTNASHIGMLFCRVHGYCHTRKLPVGECTPSIWPE